jgi:glycosyltransferase involved in cell wall biosynthesis
VAIVMPVLNEERHIVQAVDRLLRQDYQGPISIVIAVGPSHDRTSDVVDQLVAQHPNVLRVENSSGRTPTGLNAAIAATPAEVIVRVDGHALVPPDYVRRGVETLHRSGADNVGGIMDAEGVTPFQRAVASAMTSRFGVGGAAVHVGGTAGAALTVYLGCFKRSALDRVGGYDESMIRAQDWEMNYRIRATGGQVWFTPEMRVKYRPRPTPTALAKQYFGYGTWRREVARRYPDTISVRYLAAPVMVLAVIIGIVLVIAGLIAGSTILSLIGLIPVALYGAGVLAASVITGRGVTKLLLLLVFPIMHFSWGTGFLLGRARS